MNYKLPHSKIKYGPDFLGTLEDLGLMGVYERDKGARETEGWRREIQDPTKSAGWKKRQREVATQYKHGIKRGEVEGED